ncbi:MAG: M28 family peptidase [Gemmatimonadales bacterium]
MRRFALAGLVLLAGPAAAQTAHSKETAAASITATDVAHRIGIIADDSMMGRDTPSPGLEATAKYVAEQFRRVGLAPGGENGTWFQRYPITRRKLDLVRSRVVVESGGVTDVARFDRAARLIQGTVPEHAESGPAVLLGGALTPDAVAHMPLRDRMVLYAPDLSKPTDQTAAQVSRAIRLAAPRAVVIVANADSEPYSHRIPHDGPARTTVDLKLISPPVVEVGEFAVARGLRAAHLDLNQVRASTAPVMREVPGLRLTVELRDSMLLALSAPNTVGILEGSDPELKQEYLIYSAHMDHIGITPGRPDSINNGADDDGSGTIGVVELAGAFSRPGARPRRSIVFLTVSGEEKGLWGSRYFSEHPTVPIRQVVADLNIDMIGRNWPDTIVAIGKEHSDLGATLERVNRAHRELGMTAIDDIWPEERFYFRSDHYNFARKGVPILFFFNGVHPDYHQVTDSPDKINAEKEARILKLLFYLGQEVGNSPRRPKWKPESYREIVEDAS